MIICRITSLKNTYINILENLCFFPFSALSNACVTKMLVGKKRVKSIITKSYIFLLSSVQQCRIRSIDCTLPSKGTENTA